MADAAPGRRRAGIHARISRATPRRATRPATWSSSSKAKTATRCSPADAAKNRAELLSRKGRRNLRRGPQHRDDRKDLAAVEKAPGRVLVPGHDLPMTQKDGKIAYIGKRRAALKVWFGENLEMTTLIELGPR